VPWEKENMSDQSSVIVDRADNSETSVRHPRPSGRIASLDLVRGVAMILMAIDHVRVYSGIPAWGTTFGVFFTRWVTNFSAPTFVFLAGTSVYLYARKLQTRGALLKFLLIRGAWLILVELTFLRLCWTFNFDYEHYILAGVIWMIGWSMIILAAVIRLPTRVVGILGIAVVALHNVTDLFRTQLGRAFGSAGPNWLLKLLYFGGEIKLGGSGPPLMILYVLVPWVGLMFAGYGFGRVLDLPKDRQQTIFIRLGLVLTALFVLLRALNMYGDPWPWGAKHTLFEFLSTSKYPASLEFILMTIGPMFVLWYFAEQWNGRLASIVETFGRVPFFFYLLHIPLIHFAACVVSIFREGHIDPWLFANHPVAPGPAPDGYRWSLSLLYLVYGLCLFVLYFACLWFVRVKQENKAVWLSYL
jgi:uncharacterized membrane protein